MNLLYIYNSFMFMFMQAFREACGDIFITPDNAHTSFLTSVQSLFSDGVVNWGRVVALLAFSGSVAAQSVEKEMPFLVNQVVDWTSAYINANLASWIHDNGGWVSRLHENICMQMMQVIYCSLSSLYMFLK